jgi:hypothetical protein
MIDEEGFLKLKPIFFKEVADSYRRRLFVKTLEEVGRLWCEFNSYDYDSLDHHNYKSY